MAVPQRRTSKKRKRLRRSHQALEINGLVKCTNCGATIKSHNICPECGFYDGKEVLESNNKKVEKKEETKKGKK